MIRLHHATLFPHTPPPPAKLYNLTWNGETIVTNAAYPVCNGKKSELIRAGWNKKLFEIKRTTQ